MSPSCCHNRHRASLRRPHEMKSIAHELLHRLLAAGNRAKAGIRTRGAALTAAQMSAYRGLRDLRQKQDCEEVFLAAKDAGHIAVQRDPANPTDGLIDRIELRDIEGLARFLGVQSYEAVLIQARQQLAPLLDSHPVLQEQYLLDVGRRVVEEWIFPRDL